MTKAARNTMPSMAAVHRASGLKQQNKRHGKLGHRSKGQMRSQFQGRTSIQSISHKAKHELSQLERRNQVKVTRANKKEKVLNQKRKLGTDCQPPFLVCVVMLCPTINPRAVMSALTGADSQATVTVSKLGVTHVSCSRFKQRYAFVLPPIDDLYAILDTAKVCTTLLVVWPCCDRSEEVLNEDARRLLSCIKAQGLPTPVHVSLGYQDMAQKSDSSDSSASDSLVTALSQSLSLGQPSLGMQQQLQQAEAAPPQPLFNKRKAAAHQNLLQEVRYFFPGDDKVKVHQLDKPGDPILCLRQIGAQKQRPLFFRDHRPHMLAESVQLQDDEDSASTGTLQVSGYLRGAPLPVNGLVHIPGWGDYQLVRAVVHAHDPHPLMLSGGHGSSNTADGDTVLEADPTKQETPSATSEGLHDSDDDSINEDEDDNDLDRSLRSSDEDSDGRSGVSLSVKSLTTVPVRKDLIPGAYSSYQAAWMMDNDAYKEDSNSDDDDEESDDEFKAPEARLVDDDSIYGGDNDNDDCVSVASGSSELPGTTAEAYDEDMDYDVEMDEYDRIMACRNDLEFPDEIDTPRDMPARERFHKYRGLESFRTSKWDLQENLPAEYGKVFHFQRFDHFKRQVMAMVRDVQLTEEAPDFVKVGSYVTIYMKNVEKHLYQDHVETHSPLVLFGLLPHEEKLAVVNVVLKSHPVGHTRPIKSKDRLVFHVGFRRFTNQPIFSEHTLGDKQKLVRYFHPGMTVVGTMFAPVTFPPASVLVFRQLADGRQQLVATGSVYSVNADRCILKRVVLSGHPFKVHKRSVVVRYMFFDRDDILWFKPIELRTKWGRKGDIKEALGTHGHMKCQFNGSLKSQDTILMQLYKRVFPKWTYNPYTPRCPPMYTSESLNPPSDDSEDEDESGVVSSAASKSSLMMSREQRDRELMPPPAKRARQVHFS